MLDDFVLLLEDLGQQRAVEVIARFILSNPDCEDLIAAKMGALLSSSPPAEPIAQQAGSHPQNPSLETAQASPGPWALLSAAMYPYKMILIVNMDLPMGRGKQCAQVAHAALGLYLRIQQSSVGQDKANLNQWLATGEKKIVVKGNNEAHLRQLQEMARQASVPNLLVTDAGCTQIPPGSRTVLALFGTNESLDPITGALKLL